MAQYDAHIVTCQYLENNTPNDSMEETVTGSSAFGAFLESELWPLPLLILICIL